MPSSSTTLYLIRANNLTYAKQEGIVDVYLSGGSTSYGSVSGVAATDVITIPGATINDGMQVVFTQITGGAGLTANTAYFAINSSGSTCKLAQTPGGSAINFTTTISASSVILSNSEMRTWSTSFRDIFSTTGAADCGVNPDLSVTGTIPGVGTMQAGAAFGVFPTPADVVFTPTITNLSDEASHAPLRQTLLNTTFWIFDRGSGTTPRYIPAEYQEGDIISLNPPNTP